jgi:deoxyhypusine synthase
MIMKNKSFKRKRESKTIDEIRSIKIEGMPIKKDMKVSELIKNSENIGFQASHLGTASKIIKNIKKDHCKIFLSITSNIISSGLREIIAQLCEKKKIDAIITTTGAIEEDFMKASNKFLLGSFDMDDNEVKENKMNRIGNILVPDKYYCSLEEFNMKFLESLPRSSYSPSEYCKLLGKQLKDKSSVLYWCAKNNIPIYCPGIVDGAIGDHIYFFNKKNKQRFIFDVNKDVELFYDQILEADKTAGIIIGGSLPKHHLIGAAILRDGLDYAVYVCTGSEYDGSLSGAKPKEATSWNKLKDINNSVSIQAEATLVFPLLAYELLYG